MEGDQGLADPPLRVAVFSDSYVPYVSGVVRSIQLTRAALQARGHMVAIFAPTYPGRTGSPPASGPGALRLLRLPWCEEPGVYRFASVPAPRYPGFRIAVPWGPQLDRVLRDFRPDVVHVHSPFVMGRVGLAAARRLGVPVCLTVHTQYDVYLRQYAGLASVALRPLLLRSLRRFCDACDLVLAPTEQVRRRLREFGVRARVEVLPGGIPVEHFRSGDRAVLRQRFGVGADARVLVYVGRLSAEKNLWLLLDAFRAVATRDPGVHLILVGDGPLRGEVERLSGGELRGRLHLTGALSYEDLPDALAAGDLFAFPSRSETQGLAVVEAMAAGLPVVAAHSPELEEVVGDAGILVPDDPGAFAEAVHRVLHEPGLGRDLAARARARSERYALPAVTEHLLAYYRGLREAGRASA